MKKPPKLVWISLLVVSGIFYWWQLRPAHIRSVCASETIEKIQKASDEGVTRNLADWDRNYEMLFQACMNKRGLK